MFDLRAIRETPEIFIASWNRKKTGLGDKIVPDILGLDEKLRAAKTAKQEAESARNANSKLIGRAKASGDEAEAARLMAEVAQAKVLMEKAGQTEDKVHAELYDLLMGLPNLPLVGVPEGVDEAGNALQGAPWGTPRAFDFAPKDHADLGEALLTARGQSMMDFEAAVKMSGARFVALRGELARLERALSAFMLDVQTREHGYEEVSPPLLVRDHALEGTGQLPKFAEDLFFTDPRDENFREDMMLALKSAMFFGERSEPNRLYTFEEVAEYKNTALKSTAKLFQLKDTAATQTSPGSIERRKALIPTAEVPLSNLVREQILDAGLLPLRMTAHTPCFRSEAGSAGRDTKGMIRLHQFNKVELVSIVRDEEEGLAELERMTGCAEAILQKLNLPYRKMLLCAGDMGAGARKTYDLEVWLPSQATYREVSSCSYCGDFQARRMDARFRPAATEDTPKPKPEFVHTLNGSGLAVGRTLVAVLENYQEADGSITLPEALRGYMGGMTSIMSGAG